MNNMIDLSKDKDEIIYLGKRRHNLARKKGRNPLNQMGATKTPKRDILGVRGEFGICRALGIEPEITRKTSDGNPDKGYDYIWRGWAGEIKDTEHDNGHLVYQPDICSFDQDIWSLCVPLEMCNSNRDDDFCTDVRIAGWIWRKDMSEIWETCFFNPSAKCIKQYQLNRFEDLLNIDPKQGNPFF